jgi:hypothetical protein
MLIKPRGPRGQVGREWKGYGLVQEKAPDEEVEEGDLLRV